MDQKLKPSLALKQSLFQLCSNLSSLNPFSNILFLPLLFVDGIYQILIPLSFMTSLPQLASFYSTASAPRLLFFEYLVFLGGAISVFISVIFVSIWVNLHLTMKREIGFGDGRKKGLGMKEKGINTALSGLIMIYWKALRFPALLAYFVYFQRFFNTKEDPSNQLLGIAESSSIEILFLKVISVVFVFWDLTFIFFTEQFIYSPFHTKDQPMSKPPSSLHLIFNMQHYIVALTFSFDLSNSLTAKYLMVFCFVYQAFVWVANLFALRSYLTLIQKAILLIDSTLFMAFFINALFLFNKPKDFSPVLISLSFFISSIILFFTGTQLQTYVSEQNLTNNSFKFGVNAMNSITRLILLINANADDSESAIWEEKDKLKSLYFAHRESCDFRDCICLSPQYTKCFTNLENLKNTGQVNNKSFKMRKQESTFKTYKKQKMLLIELIVYSYKSNIDLDKHYKMLDFFLIKYRLLLLNHQYSNYFSLLKIHNCSEKRCALTPCFLTFKLKQELIEAIQADQKLIEENINIEKNLKYEEYFQTFVQSINFCIQTQLQYWRTLISEQVELEQILEAGESCAKSYELFQDSYEMLVFECEPMKAVEILAHKMKKEVFNFEYESEIHLSKLNAIMIKNKFNEEEQNALLMRDKQTCFLMISTEPHSFSEITNFSKQFSLFSGYKEEDLLNQKPSLLMPIIIAESHDILLRQYITHPKSSSKKKQIHSLLKHQDNTITPIDIVTYPYLSQAKGLSQIAMITVPSHLNIFENRVSLTSVFIILANESGTILNMSSNCFSYLKLNKLFVRNDNQITDLFPGINQFSEEELSEGRLVKLDAEKHILSQIEPREAFWILQYIVYSVPDHRAQLQVKIQLQSHQILGSKYQQYLFMLTNEYDYSQMRTIQGSTQDLAQNFSFQGNQQLLHQKSLGQPSHEATIQLDSAFLLFEEARQPFEVDEYVMSISSTATPSSFKEVKSDLSLKQLPTSLAQFKKKIVAFYLIMFMTSVTILGVNVQQSRRFKSDLTFIEDVQEIMHQMDIIDLSVLYQYALANTNSSHFKDLSRVSLSPSPSLYLYFQSSLNQSLSSFQRTSVDLALTSLARSSNVRYYFHTLLLDFYTYSTKGKEIKYTANIGSLINYLIQSAQSLSSMSVEKVKVPFSVYGVMESDLEMVSPVSDVIKDVYFLIGNNMFTLKRTFNQIAETLQLNASEQMSSIKQLIMIFTIVCSVIVVMASSLILPFLFNIDFELVQMLEMTLNIEKTVMTGAIKQINGFETYMNSADYIEKIQCYGKGERPFEDINVQNEDKRGQKTNSNEHSFNVKIQAIPTFQNQQSNGVYNSTNLFMEEELKEQVIPRSKFQSKRIMQEMSNDDEGYQHKDLIKTSRQQVKEDKQKSTPEKDQDIMSKDSKSFSSKDAKANLGKGNRKQSSKKNARRDTLKGFTNENMTDYQEDPSKLLTKTSFQPLKTMALLQKIKKALFIFAFAAAICVFYIGTYFLAVNQFEQVIDGFASISVFYSQQECLSNLFFMSQRDYLFNKEVLNPNTNKSGVEEALAFCEDTQNSYREISRNKNRFIQPIEANLTIIESNQQCEFMNTNGISNISCDSLDGILKLGYSQTINTFMAKVNQRTIAMQTFSNRSKADLQREFFDSDVLNYAVLIQTSFSKLIKFLQESVEASLMSNLEGILNSIIVVFSIFIIFLVVSLVGVFKKTMNYIQGKVIQTTLQMKFIPSDEFLRLKEELGKKEKKGVEKVKEQ